jgi:tetratricopeptide (TPR) repeat protein
MAKTAANVFNRRAVLDRAQLLVQRNKLPMAIEAYEQLVQHNPADWNSANTLGDLLVRTGLVERAIREYVRTAEHLASSGFLARASAIYQKLLRLDPGHPEALRHVEALNIERFAKVRTSQPGHAPSETSRKIVTAAEVADNTESMSRTADPSIAGRQSTSERSRQGDPVRPASPADPSTGAAVQEGRDGSNWWLDRVDPSLA